MIERSGKLVDHYFFKKRIVCQIGVIQENDSLLIRCIDPKKMEKTALEYAS